MDIFTIKLEGCQNILLSFNWIAVIILALLTTFLLGCIRWLCKKSTFKSFQFEEATIGIGDSSITIKYDGRVKEIAYKIWVELTTRKIGINFDEDYDVISEVYNSWYDAFRAIRNLLQEIPAERIRDAKGLIELTTKVLNCGLRPHLTMWQAKFRTWYATATEDTRGLSPQEIQKEYPAYEDLVNSLKKANDIMTKYIAELNRFIDTK